MRAVNAPANDTSHDYLEWYTRRKDHRMVVLSIPRYGYLVTGTEGQTYAIVDWDAADQQARREKELIYSGALAVGPPRIVGLEFRPEVAKNAVLKSRIEGQRHP